MTQGRREGASEAEGKNENSKKKNAATYPRKSSLENPLHYLEHLTAPRRTWKKEKHIGVLSNKQHT